MWCRISSGTANPGSRSSCLCINFMINGKSKTPCEWTVLSTRATFLHTDQRWKKWWFFAFESAHNARCDNEDNDNDMMESTKATIIMYHSIPLQHFCFFFYAHIHTLSPSIRLHSPLHPDGSGGAVVVRATCCVERVYIARASSKRIISMTSISYEIRYARAICKRRMMYLYLYTNS